jgi:hypothetical protein
MQQINLGYAISRDLSRELRRLLDLHIATVEISLTTDFTEQVYRQLTPNNLALLNQFKRVSLHAPTGPYFASTGEPNGLLRQIISVAERAEVQLIVFHPDQIDNLAGLDRLLGDRLGLENMDKNKTFGRTLTDMKQVFQAAPHAKWVCDVNHFYTNKYNLDELKNWFIKLGGKLGQYHISAYGGDDDPHDCFINFPTHSQNEVLSFVLDRSKPLIHEGGATFLGDENFLKRENQYVLNYFN